MTQAEKKPHPRDLLIEAAQSLFVERGYDAVSTRELAERAGVNLGAIQYHFGSKAALFVESVSQLMHGNSCERVAKAVNESLQSREQGAVGLCQFINAFLHHLLCPSGEQPCRMMFREILTSSDPELHDALIDATLREFMEPIRSTLYRVLRAVTPESSQLDTEFAARSIVGQCTFYLTHAPFLKKMHGIDFSAEEHRARAAESIMRFSLRALGCSEEEIHSGIQRATHHG